MIEPEEESDSAFDIRCSAALAGPSFIPLMEALVADLRRYDPIIMTGRFIPTNDNPATVNDLIDTLFEMFTYIDDGYQMDFRNLDAESIHPEHLAAVLRASSSFRANVQGWHEALEVCKLAARKANLDETDLLFGMLDTKP